MLAPEVWKFNPPASTLKIQKGSLDSCGDIEDVIKSHHYNHLVSVVLPDTPQVSQSILESLSSDNEYYLADDIPASEFIEKEFIDAFVKKGSITAVSVKVHLDINNCLGLVGKHLLLSLNKESYQELGLEGKPILSKNKEHQRFIVSLDLTASHFTPEKRNYERAYKCLKNFLHTFSVLLVWEPEDEKICPSSVASYLDDKGFNIKVCKPSFNQKRDFNVAVPQLYPPDKECDINEMMEWLGSYSLNIESSSSPDSEFVSSYRSPEETVDCGQVAFLSWKGFFSTSQVMRLFKALKEYFEDRDGIPWVGLYVQGFADAPISWKLRPHTFFTDGDNSYTIILKPKNSFLMVSHYSNTKMIK